MRKLSEADKNFLDNFFQNCSEEDLNRTWTYSEIKTRYSILCRDSPDWDWVRILAFYFNRVIPAGYYKVKDEYNSYLLDKFREYGGLIEYGSGDFWDEHIALSTDIAKFVFGEPFLVQCDDYEFLYGAICVALRENGLTLDHINDLEIIDEGEDFWEIRVHEEEI